MAKWICLKAHLVAKGYTQVLALAMVVPFPWLPRFASIRLLLFMVVMCSWFLYQLDIKNVVLHGDLAEEVYMEKPTSFVAQGKFGSVCRLHHFFLWFETVA